MDRTFSQYYKEVSETKQLSPKDERALFLRFKRKRDLNARDELVHNCLRTVVKIAARYSRDPEIFKDLIASGNIGILRALDRYDPSYNTRFLSYATYWIHLFIREEASSNLIPLPKWRKKAIAKICREQEKIYLREGRKASEEDLRGCTQLSDVQLGRLLRSDGNPQFTATEENNDPHLSVAAHFALDLDASRTRNLFKDEVLKLPQRECFVLLSYYGLVTPAMSLREIGSIINMSSERVRQIKVHAMDRIRGHLGRCDEFAAATTG
jgi:RNA polymerase sigma factor (sigma-70 family)